MLWVGNLEYIINVLSFWDGHSPAVLTVPARRVDNSHIVATYLTNLGNQADKPTEYKSVDNFDTPHTAASQADPTKLVWRKLRSIAQGWLRVGGCPEVDWCIGTILWCIMHGACGRMRLANTTTAVWAPHVSAVSLDALPPWDEKARSLDVGDNSDQCAVDGSAIILNGWGFCTCTCCNS